MKSRLTCCLLIGCCCMLLCAQEMTYNITLSNNWNESKEYEPVVLNLNDLKLNFTPKSATVWVENEEIASQLDDLTGDFVADELAFLVNMPANSKKKVKITFSSKKSNKQYPPQVYAEMLISDKKEKHPQIQSLTTPGTSYVYNNLHHHGPAFESELTAFRTYFDQRQSVDIYGKQKKQLELSTTQFYPTQAQIDEGYGDDVLWAGTTVGLGSLRGYDNGKLLNIEPVAWRTECIRAYGPIRTVVDIIDNAWEYQGKELNMTSRYILYGGHRDVRVELSFNEELEKEQFCTGIIKLEKAELFNNSKGLAACWGENWPYGKKDTIDHPKVTLGLGIYVPQKYINGEPENVENVLYLIGAAGEKNLNYFITFSTVRENFGYKNSQEWFSYVEQWENNLNHPLIIEIEK